MTIVSPRWLFVVLLAWGGCITLPPSARERVAAIDLGDDDDGPGSGGGGGSTTAGPLPICPSGECAQAVDVAPGAFHSCMLASDGYVRCWGSNTMSELGDPLLPKTSPHAPTLVEGLADVDELVAGSHHTCARVGGEVYCWGANAQGQLGQGDTNERATPSLVPLPEVVHVSTNARATCALTAGAQVYCWGLALNGQDFLGPDIEVSPQPVAGLSDLTAIDGLVVGQTSACVTAQEGAEVRCWGNNGRGYLGDGTGVSSPVPVPVAASLAVPVTHLAIGTDVACALGGADPEFQCWGDMTATHGEVFEPLTIPELNAGALVEIAVGWHHMAQLDDSGRVTCFGQSTYGECGVNGGNGEPVFPPVVAATGMESIRTGWMHNCGIRVDGSVVCWGRNQHGQTNPADTEVEVRTPTAVAFAP